ncbi:MAG: flagellar export protein FliJ [Thiobacillaceae bacterium]|nr:flagellar export protein FliJ [Thiobacillaceae bacterium]
MAKRFPLQPLLEHSQHRMEAAERLLRLLKQKEEEARRRLQDLQGFRQEYQARLGSTSADGMHIHLLRDYHLFLAKIELAIRQQEGEVEQAHARWQSAHQGWLEQRQKVKAYEVLAERHRASESRKADKREQRLSDEQANRHLPPAAGGE